MKKYDKTIRSLKADNAELQEELKNADQQSVQKVLADAKLRADYENLLRQVEKIPPEIMFLYTGRGVNRGKEESR